MVAYPVFLSRGEQGERSNRRSHDAGMCMRSTPDTQEGRRVQEQTQQLRFEQIVLPHLDAAYNLARWLTRHDQDAEDVIQEA